MGEWQRSDWRGKARVQMPDYPDAARLDAVERRLASYPPLVFAGEARRLKAHLAKVAAGEEPQAQLPIGQQGAETGGHAPQPRPSRVPMWQLGRRFGNA